MLPGTKMSTIVVMYKTWKHLQDSKISATHPGSSGVHHQSAIDRPLKSWPTGRHTHAAGENFGTGTGPRNRRAPMSHASKGREGKYAKAQKGVYKVTKVWMQTTRRWNIMKYQCSINVQAMCNGPIANSEHASRHGRPFFSTDGPNLFKEACSGCGRKASRTSRQFHTKDKLQDRTGFQILQEHSNLRLIESRCSSEDDLCDRCLGSLWLGIIDS